MSRRWPFPLSPLSHVSFARGSYRSLTTDKAKAIPQLLYRIKTDDWCHDYAPLVADGTKYGRQYAIWRSQQANPRYFIEFERKRRRSPSSSDGGDGGGGGESGGIGARGGGGRGGGGGKRGGGGGGKRGGVGSSDQAAGDKIIWLPTGSQWLGRRVRRHHKGRAVDGLLTAWVPEVPGVPEDAALWRMVHDDGDLEDLEEAEVHEALAAYAARRSVAAGSSKGKAPTARPADGSKFSIGLIADVQYADKDAGTSHDRSMLRRYREALNTLSRAVDWWGELPKIKLIVQLGDLVDGSNAQQLGQSKAALEQTLAVLRHAPCETTHVLGNHDLYNFSRAALAELAEPTGFGAGHYSLTVGCAWRVVVVDSYQISAVGWPESDPRHARANDLLVEKNHNIAAGAKDWLAGMKGPARRYTPLNGALGEEQREWLRGELEAAARQAQRVILLSHCVVHPNACDGTTMLWDSPEVLEVIHGVGVVAAVICGHDHKGGYHLDAKGLHHLTLCSPLNKQLGEAFGALEVHDDHLQLSGPRLADFIGGGRGQAVGRLDLPPLPTPPNACTRVLLLRHGQSEANADTSRSIVDPLLTDLGRSQASRLAVSRAPCLLARAFPSRARPPRSREPPCLLSQADAWKGFSRVSMPPDVVLVSPLRRALETAAIAFEGTTTSIEVVVAARELHGHGTDGENTVGSLAEAKKMLQPLGLTFQGLEAARGGESKYVGMSVEESRREIKRVLRARAEETVLLVCHWGVIRALVGEEVSNGTLLECDRDPATGKLTVVRKLPLQKPARSDLPLVD